MPFGVKDLFDQRGLPTTAGLTGDHLLAAADADAVARLRAAGAVSIGKTAMDQLGCTTGGQAPGFPPCFNPVDAGWSPGGSSSGSAVAVAAGVVPFALGSDTAGSCRIPAAYCGITGFKPASGAISAAGCVPIMPGFDQPGILARDVATCESAYRVLTAPLADGAAESGQRDKDSDPLRIAMLADHLFASEEPVTGAVRERMELVASSSDRRIEFIYADFGWEPKGFGALLARSLALTWGERARREPERFNEVVRSTIEFGATRGEAADREIRDEIARAERKLSQRFAQVDVLAGPAVPVPAPDRDAERIAVSSRFARPFNALGWPAIVIPVRAAPDGRPIGLQLVSPSRSLGRLFEAARALER